MAETWIQRQINSVLLSRKKDEEELYNELNYLLDHYFRFDRLSISFVKGLELSDRFYENYTLFLVYISSEDHEKFFDLTYNPKYDHVFEEFITGDSYNCENYFLMLLVKMQNFDLSLLIKPENIFSYMEKIFQRGISKYYESLIDIEVKNNWLTIDELENILQLAGVILDTDLFELFYTKYSKVSDLFQTKFLEFIFSAMSNDSVESLEYMLSKIEKEKLIQNSLPIMIFAVRKRNLQSFPILLKYNICLNANEILSLQKENTDIPAVTRSDISTRDKINVKLNEFKPRVQKKQEQKKTNTKGKNKRNRRKKKSNTPQKKSNKYDTVVPSQIKFSITEESDDLNENKEEVIEEPSIELNLQVQNVKKEKKIEVKVSDFFESSHFELSDEEDEDSEEIEGINNQETEKNKKIVNENNEIEEMEENQLEDIAGPREIFDEFEEYLWNVAARECAFKKWYKMENSMKQQIFDIMKELGQLGPYCRSNLKKTFKRVTNAQDFYYCKINTICMIWGKSIEFSEKVECKTDIIKIWDICTREKLYSVIKEIIQSEKQPSDYQNNFFIQKSENPYGPNKYFEKQQEINKELKYFPSNALRNSYSIEKFYDISEPVGLYIVQSTNQSSTYETTMFKIEQSEFDVINEAKKGSSMILLGRSGTGKTTCAMTFMWKYFYSYWKSNNLNTPSIVGKINEDNYENFHLHQIFLTANTVLRSEASQKFNTMKEQYLSMYRPYLINDSEVKLPKHLLNEIDIKNFPLFLTTREWIVMIDGSLDNHFFERKGIDKKLKNSENFLKRDQFTTMAAKMKEFDTIDDDEDDDNDKNDIIFNNKLKNTKNNRKNLMNQEIDASLFKKLYENEHFGKFKYPWSLVWKEIYSYIKGSMEIILSQTKTGYLTKEQYIEIGRKKAPNFKGNREEIYEIFEAYQQYIQRKRLYDLNDVIFHCIKELHKKPYSGIPIHHITYDEVQDATQIELYLYFLIIEDKNKFFFTGDTCQTIAQGVGFRFSDLRSIFHFYKTELEAQNAKNQETQGITIAVPEITNLVRNYRSHRGITRLAAGIVELLKFFFPESFDSVSADDGIRDGPKPIFISSQSTQELYSILYDNTSTDLIEFGADQVIIVRDEAAKEKLPEELLDAAICMTVFESKGLEFNEVFLYNFFTDSEYSTEWKYIDYYNNECREDSIFNNNETIKIYNQNNSSENLSIKELIAKLPNDYKNLCDELKYLYVAITRAKQNIIIYEKTTKASSIVNFLKNRELVTFLQGTDIENKMSNIQNQFNKKSSKSDWNENGEKIYAKGNYKAARFCFKKAGNIEKENLCVAHIAWEEAELASNSHLKNEKLKAKGKYLEAAELFYDCGYYQYAAHAFQKLNKQKRIFQCLQQERRWKHCAQISKSLRDYDNCCNYLILNNNLYGGIKLLIDNKRYYKLYELLVHYILPNQYNINKFNKNLKSILDQLHVPVNIYKNLFVINNNQNMEFAKSIFRIIPPYEITKCFKNKDENNKLVSLLTDEFFDESSKNHFIFFRNIHIQKRNYTKAIQLSKIDIDCYYETLRGVIELNCLDSSKLENQEFIYQHINTIKKKLPTNSRDNIVSQVSLYISFAKWIKEKSNLLIETFENDFCELKKYLSCLKAMDTINGYQIIIINYYNIYVEFFKIPVDHGIYDFLTCQFYEEILYGFFTLLKAYAGKRDLEEYKLKIKFDYWKVRKNQITHGFTINILSPLAKALNLQNEQFEFSNVSPKLVYTEILNNTLHLLLWALKTCDLYFNENLVIDNLEYDYKHFTILKSAVLIKNMIEEFLSNENVAMLFRQYYFFSNFPLFKDIFQGKYFTKIYKIIRSSIHPPNVKEYWETLHIHYDNIGKIIVPFLTKERIRKDVVSKKLSLERKTNFYLSLKSQCDYFYQIHFDPRKKDDILGKIKTNFDPKGIGSLLRAENNWYDYDPVSAFYNFKRFSDKILAKEKLFSTFINFIEIWALRFVLLIYEETREANYRYCPYTLFVKIAKQNDANQEVSAHDYTSCCVNLFGAIKNAFSSPFLTERIKYQLIIISCFILFNVKFCSSRNIQILYLIKDFKELVIHSVPESEIYESAIEFCFHDNHYSITDIKLKRNITSTFVAALNEYDKSDFLFIKKNDNGWEITKKCGVKVQVKSKEERDKEKIDTITKYLSEYIFLKQKIESQKQAEILNNSNDYPFDSFVCPDCEYHFDNDTEHDECTMSKKDQIRQIYHQITKPLLLELQHKFGVENELKESIFNDVRKIYMNFISSQLLLIFFYFLD